MTIRWRHIQRPFNIRRIGIDDVMRQLHQGARKHKITKRGKYHRHGGRKNHVGQKRPGRPRHERSYINLGIQGNDQCSQGIGRRVVFILKRDFKLLQTAKQLFRPSRGWNFPYRTFSLIKNGAIAKLYFDTGNGSLQHHAARHDLGLLIDTLKPLIVGENLKSRDNKTK